MKLVLPLVALLCFLVSAPARAIELVRWEKVPIAVALKVDTERVVFTPSTVRVGVPPELQNVLRVQVIDGAIYLKANEAFPATRVSLQEVDSGAVILLDVSADSSATALEPVRIVIDGQESVAGEEPKAPQPATPGPGHDSPIPVILTRFAAQNLYAPARAIEPVPGVARVRLPVGFDAKALMPTLALDVTPVAAWRLGDFYVTALRLKNLSPRPVVLDPRRIAGDLVAATFQHGNLGSHGGATDTTALYIVTRGKGLMAALPTGAAHEK
jgi:integrating conjugative element protein (TIGR03749 family)